MALPGTVALQYSMSSMVPVPVSDSNRTGYWFRQEFVPKTSGDDKQPAVKSATEADGRRTTAEVIRPPPSPLPPANPETEALMRRFETPACRA